MKDTFDKYEWKKVCQEINPNLTDEEYEEHWEGFKQMKAKHAVDQLLGQFA